MIGGSHCWANLDPYLFASVNAPPCAHTICHADATKTEMLESFGSAMSRKQRAHLAHLVHFSNSLALHPVIAT